MLGLVSYDSDDGDEQQQQPEAISAPQQPSKPTIPASTPAPKGPVEASLQGGHSVVEEEKVPDSEPPAPTPAPLPAKVTIPHSPSRPLFPPPAPGPALPQQQPDTSPLPGPSLPPPTTATSPYASPTPAPPLSPYSLTRSQIHTLTLPHTIPPIPCSPPHPAPPHTSSKFTTFLTLKRQGVHFNQKLTQSPSLRNPQLLEKLLGFVGISAAICPPENGVEGFSWSGEQYTSTLPRQIWDYEAWARDEHRSGFVEELRKSQNEVLEKRQRRAEEERARGAGKVAFVSEKGSTLGIMPASAQSKAERVMAGVDRAGREEEVSPMGARGENGARRGGSRNQTQLRSRGDRREGGRGGGGDDYYRTRDRGRERDRWKMNRSRSQSRSRDRERERESERYRR